MNKRIAAVVLATLALAGCVNPYAYHFRYATGMTPMLIAARRAGPPPPQPEVVPGTNPKTDLLEQESDGYMPIGYANFSASPGAVPRDGAIKEGRIVGADRVLVFSHYQGTVTTLIPTTTPTQQTTSYNQNASVFGTGGVEETNNSGTATTTTYQTSYTPLSIPRYSYLAVYLIKARWYFGAIGRPVTVKEARAIGTVDAVRLVVVVRGTPAAAAGLLPGDIVTDVDGRAVTGVNDFAAVLREKAGRTVRLTVVRNGKTTQKIVALPGA